MDPNSNPSHSLYLDGLLQLGHIPAFWYHGFKYCTKGHLIPGDTWQAFVRERRRAVASARRSGWQVRPRQIGDM